ncbi:HotDog domain-containing protein [Helicostylum pulchrum]|uniref:Thioesterase domain-containing protein n=1 Tax=Helicostylum pulchrum TaxID=562976 RepID=A0ABP9XZ09_9FUNG|nr:HotDog domain-containing protein [Helicostylum pulchrum]
MQDKHTMSKHSATMKRVEIVEEHEVLSPEEQELKNQEQQLAIVKELRSSEEWYETTPYNYMTPSAIEHSLTAHSLRGPHKILRRPLKFFNKDKTKCIVIVYLGDHMCNKEVIHNGVLATLLDEHLAYVTLPHLPNSTGFTANLNVDYHETVSPNQWMIIQGQLDKVDGRKAYADAWIENIKGVRIAEARALYISPRTQ